MLKYFRMFKSSSTLFTKVKCPKLSECVLSYCPFDHHSKRRLSSHTHHSEKEATKRQKVGNIDIPKDLLILVPKPLIGQSAPAPISQRIIFVTELSKAYIKHNVPLPNKKAVDNEFEIAKTSSSLVYNNKMKQFIRKAQRNEIEYFKPEKSQVKQLTKEETYIALKRLIPTLTTLKRNQYITEPPTSPQVQDLIAKDLKKCDRCHEDFNLSEITVKTSCKFHERKKRREQGTFYWECCEQIVGESPGCKESEHHVFKSIDPFEMKNLIPFRETADAKKAKEQRIIGLDCEMGYTSKGLELIRLTIVDFYTGKTTFDEIIKPSGVVLDLNTTWSGVSEIPETSMTLSQLQEQLFNDFIDYETIMVGHGLENDLNALRIIHHNVVDTSILFPKSLNFKYALKDLAFTFLNRKIQSGEHSSEEDSLAAIDIVKLHISRND